jgi:hypothetical protein
MSKLLTLIDDIKQQISDNQYKLIVEELAEEQEQKLSISKIKAVIPFLKKDNDEDCDDHCYGVFQEIFIFIVPTSFVVQKNLSPGIIVPLILLYEASINHDENFFENNILRQHLQCSHIHVQSTAIINIEQINP